MISCWNVFLLFVGAYVLMKMYGWFKFYAKRRENTRRAIAAGQRPARKYQKISPEIEKIIQSCETIQDLLKSQFEGKITAKMLIEYTVEKTERIGRQLNISADENFEQALEMAKERDQQLQEWLTQRKDPFEELGSLHGIPFSVKDQINLKGTLCTLGVGSRADNVSSFDANVVTVFKNQGGIPVVKGNIPIIWLSIHSTNKIWGWAKNPWNNERSVGGSSGGDAALLTCVNFGIGSDLGGSLRCPASFCGVNAFMPTARRQICHGNEGYTIARQGDMHPMNIVLGPLTRNWDDILRLMKIYLSEEKLKLDGLDKKMKFNQNDYNEAFSNKKLKIGTIVNYDEVLSLCPTGKRILDEAKEHLLKLGHEVIEIEIPDFEEQWANQGIILINEQCHFVGEESNIHCDDLEGLNLLISLYNGCSFIPKAAKMLMNLIGEKRAATAIQSLVKVDGG